MCFSLLAKLGFALFCGSFLCFFSDDFFFWKIMVAERNMLIEKLYGKLSWLEFESMAYFFFREYIKRDCRLRSHTRYVRSVPQSVKACCIGQNSQKRRGGRRGDDSESTVSVDIGDVVRLKPYQYIHVHDNNSNCSRVVLGPCTFTRQEHEQVLCRSQLHVITIPNRF